ncbi:GhoT/OrtT family toxin [Providencia sp. PROV188]|uniref:GhoT/OrtT family toxin n=1 Tax=Providencia zhijiangensis TaxID=3053982 RepID=A0ABZ0N4F5_9GAMM|nr:MULTISPECIES: GhoT/OrtT family toxin [Providencia]MTC75848.1 GhoT/OrtT family toxin [Providencia sp. wls1919]MBC5789865.1 GhoT/OrtT family toxin [Providencia sp. JUb39]MBG5881577.1 GhoT/OrtT family toxin [Providencia alcalifaciens]MBS0924035.1 GhoT/OrtT family toxin [Providencia sp. JGM181]MBS0932091.1 GhoT/OrtT family toxin [Providencia sp. JGM172]
MSTFEHILLIYGIGGVCSALFALLVTKDPSFCMRLLSALLIGFTWPLSLPVALMFSLF